MDELNQASEASAMISAAMNELSKAEDEIERLNERIRTLEAGIEQDALRHLDSAAEIDEYQLYVNAMTHRDRAARLRALLDPTGRQ